MNFISEDLIKHVPVIVVIVPLCWGIVELRKLRIELNRYKPLLQNFNTTLTDASAKFNDINHKKFDNYPFFKDINEIIVKTNKIIK
tara:strand:- start:10040 stop:10297 length:258 start_codon:yes stop_codon:yes gene_type:complete